MMDPSPMSQRDREEARAETQAVPAQTVLFEGMMLTQEQVDSIKSVRSRAQYIKDGIDIEHINSYQDLVRVFRIALQRAEREVELNKALKF